MSAMACKEQPESAEIVDWRSLGGKRIAGFVVSAREPRDVADAIRKLQRLRSILRALVEADLEVEVPVDLPACYYSIVLDAIRTITAYLGKIERDPGSKPPHLS